MAVSAIARQSEDKIMRQAYQRRKDEIYFNNLERAEDRRKLEQAEYKAEQEQRRAEQEQRRAEQEQRRAEQAEAENEQLRQQIIALQANRNLQ